jgi:hypothetical protein
MVKNLVSFNSFRLTILSAVQYSTRNIFNFPSKHKFVHMMNQPPRTLYFLYSTRILHLWGQYNKFLHDGFIVVLYTATSQINNLPTFKPHEFLSLDCLINPRRKSLPYPSEDAFDWLLLLAKTCSQDLRTKNHADHQLTPQGSHFEFPVWNLMHFPFESHNSLRDSILTPVKLSI